jgi:hypothetical protein
MCLSEEDIEQTNSMAFKFYLYPVFMLISVIFLFLTLVAFTMVPEMQNLHGKSIACQSGTLMIAFIGFAVTNLAGFLNISVATCKAFGNIEVFLFCTLLI